MSKTLKARAKAQSAASGGSGSDSPRDPEKLTDRVVRLARGIALAALAGLTAKLLVRAWWPPGRPAAVLPLDGAGLLLVEDDADTREAMSALLQLEGAAVTAAASAETALAGLSETPGPPQAVVCDIDLPGQNGEAFMQGLRVLEARRGWRRIPVLALTGRAGPRMRQRLQDAGFYVQLAKPVPVSELLQQLKRACGLPGALP